LEARSGVAGKREYIQVLQLVRDFSVTEVAWAIKKAFAFGCPNFDSVKMISVSFREPFFEPVPLSQEKLQTLPRVLVEVSDPGCYGALLKGGAL
jgi:hypothetical protein